MVMILDAINMDLHDDVQSAMYSTCLKSQRIFGATLPADDQGKDGFDKIDPTYLVALSGRGTAAGLIRLLPTTGPHTLSQANSDIIGGDFPLRAPNLWECSRLEIDPDLGAPFCIERLEVAAKLLTAGIELAMNSGVSDLIFIYNEYQEELLKRVGATPYDVIGSVTTSGDRVLSAGLLDCTAERMDTILTHTGVRGRLKNDREAREYLDGFEFQQDVATPDPQDPFIAPFEINDAERLQIARRCFRQIEEAETLEERSEAMKSLGMILGLRR